MGEDEGYFAIPYERIHLGLREESRPHFICFTPQNSCREEKKSMASSCTRLKADSYFFKNAVESKTMTDVADLR